MRPPELLPTRRNYDVENDATLPALTAMADEIANCLERALPFLGLDATIDRSEPLFREVSSRDVDEIQAADIAAGWARELVVLGQTSALATMFERVWINGTKVR
jgi:hypothetical protein